MSDKYDDRPIPFNGPNVRAILDGRKAQDRRVAKPQPVESFSRRFGSDGSVIHEEFYGWSWQRDYKSSRYPCPSPNMARWCPYGKPGDRLWVRETWGAIWPDWCDDGRVYDDGTEFGRPITDRECRIEYRADADGDDRPGGWPREETDGPNWRPSVHMSRWACRITLEITGVRVERLQEISETDAQAEGAERGMYVRDTLDGPEIVRTNYRDGFRALWDSINGKKHPWSSDPWVWAISFRRLE